MMQLYTLLMLVSDWADLLGLILDILRGRW